MLIKLPNIEDVTIAGPDYSTDDKTLTYLKYREKNKQHKIIKNGIYYIGTTKDNN